MGAIIGERGLFGSALRIMLAGALAGALALQFAPPGVADADASPPPTEPAASASPAPTEAPPTTELPAVVPTPTATATEPEATSEPKPGPSESTLPTETPQPDALAQAAEPIMVAPGNLRAFSGKRFEESLSITGGTAPYTASTTDVPEGLSFDPATLTFSGIPTSSGSLVTVTVTDSSQPQQTVEAYVYVDVATYWEPSVYPAYGELPPGYAGFPDGVVGRQYEVPLGYTGSDRENITVGVLSGQLPPGLSLAQERVHSVPTSAGTYHFTLRVQDRYGFRDQSFSIIVHELGMETAGYPVPPAVLGEPYSARIASATGGVAPYVFGYATRRHFAGGLSSSDPGPDGLFMDANGYLTGTPTRAGSFLIRVYVRDGDALTQDIFWTTVTVLETRPDTEQPIAVNPPADVAPPAPPGAVLPAGTLGSSSGAGLTDVELAATGVQSGRLTTTLWSIAGLLTVGFLVAAAGRRRHRGGRSSARPA